MMWSENKLKWIMRFYPPLLFQRVWVLCFNRDFDGVKVKINKSLLNMNPNGSIFGGTIFAAADPFYPVLFNQKLNRNGHKRLKIWSKSSHINFLKPALSDLFFEISLTKTDIDDCRTTLLSKGKYERAFPIDIHNKSDETCVSIVNEIYIRDLDFKN